MNVVLTVGAVVALMGLLVLGVCYLCFRMAFYSENPPVPEGEIPTPEGEIYDPYRDKMKKWIKIILIIILIAAGAMLYYQVEIKDPTKEEVKMTEVYSCKNINSQNVKGSHQVPLYW